jgi:hypothetical protein
MLGCNHIKHWQCRRTQHVCLNSANHVEPRTFLKIIDCNWCPKESKYARIIRFIKVSYPNCRLQSWKIRLMGESRWRMCRFSNFNFHSHCWRTPGVECILWIWNRWITRRWAPSTWSERLLWILRAPVRARKTGTPTRDSTPKNDSCTPAASSKKALHKVSYLNSSDDWYRIDRR